jgi:hypothetical protein
MIPDDQPSLREDFMENRRPPFRRVRGAAPAAVSAAFPAIAPVIVFVAAFLIAAVIALPAPGAILAASARPGNGERLAVAESESRDASQNVLTAAEWAEDLDFLVKTVIEKHRHPFDKVSREDFEKAAAELRRNLAGLRDHEIVAGFVRLVAMLRDGHSRLTLPVGPGADTQSHTATAQPRPGLAFRTLPLQLYLFSDGLYVQAAAPELVDLVGAKVIGFGGMSAEDALKAIRPVISYDSEMWISQTAPSFLLVPEILQACGVIGELGNVPLVVEKAGTRMTVTVEPLAPGAPDPKWKTYIDIRGGEKPLSLRHRDKPFWLEYPAGPRLLYVQINAIADDKDETFGAFAVRLREFLETRDVDKLVLDLRFNGGGNNYLNRGLVLAVAGAGKINRYGRVFTIIGRNTFSAAISLVSALEHWTETIFVGEPTGNTPSQYGDARRYPLPRSGLTVRLSSVYWRDWSVRENRPWVAPDMRVDVSWADYAAGRDPALEAVLSYTAPPTLLGQLQEKIRWGGMDAGAMHLYRFSNSPVTGNIRTEEPLVALAAFLVGEKRLADARNVLKECLSAYPDSFDALVALGKIQLESGEAKNAVETLKKAAALRPGDSGAAGLLKKAEAQAGVKK